MKPSPTNGISRVVTIDHVEQFDYGERARAQQALVGRETALERLEELATHTGGVVTVTGPPGVGKSHLLAVAVERLRGRRFEEVVRPELRSVDSAAELGRAVARALGVRDSDQIEERLAVAFERRGNLLVVLDGIDSLLRDEASRRATGEQLREWCDGVDAPTILVGARRRLGISVEHCVDLPPLDPEAGVELFVRRARRVRSDFEMDPATRTTVRELVEHLDGLPQAIELAASRCRVLGPTQLLERLQRRRREADGDTTQLFAPLKRALAEMTSTLPNWGRRAVEQLRVFRGRFAPESAERVLELSDDAPPALDALEHLVDRSIVETRSNARGDVRFEMLRTVRQFIDGQAPEGGDAARRHAEMYARRSLEWWRARGTSEAPAAKRALVEARPQLVAAYGRALDHEWSCAVRLAVGLVALHTDCKDYDAAKSVFDRLSASNVEPSGVEDEALMHYGRAFLQAVDGAFSEAERAARQAIECARRADDTLLVGRIEAVRVQLVTADDAFERAFDHLDRAEDALLDADGADAAIRVQLLHAGVCRAMDEQHEAERYAREALELARRHELPRRRLVARMQLALLNAELETFDDAMEHVDTAEELNDQLPRWASESDVPSIAASIYHSAGRFDRAQTLYEKGIRMKRREGAIGSVAESLIEYGLLLLESGEPGRARQKFVESQRIAPARYPPGKIDLRGGQKLGIALSYAFQGRLEAARNELEDADRRLDERSERTVDSREHPADAFVEMAANAHTIVDVLEMQRTLEDENSTAAEAEAALGELERSIDQTAGASTSVVGRLATRRLARQELERTRKLVECRAENDEKQRILRVHSQLDWLEIDGESRVDLSRRGSLQRVLESLIEAHIESDAGANGTRSVYDLLEAGWPDQPADPESGKSRVYTTVRRLRDLGLDDVLETVEDGYRLSPEVAVERTGP